MAGTTRWTGQPTPLGILFRVPAGTSDREAEASGEISPPPWLRPRPQGHHSTHLRPYAEQGVQLQEGLHRARAVEAEPSWRSPSVAPRTWLSPSQTGPSRSRCTRAPTPWLLDLCSPKRSRKGTDTKPSATTASALLLGATESVRQRPRGSGRPVRCRPLRDLPATPAVHSRHGLRLCSGHSTPKTCRQRCTGGLSSSWPTAWS